MSQGRRIGIVDLGRLLRRRWENPTKTLDEPNNNPKSIRKSLCGEKIPDKIVIRVEQVVYDRMKKSGVLPDGFVTFGEGIFEGQPEESISFDCAAEDVSGLDYALSLFMKSARKEIQEKKFIFSSFVLPSTINSFNLFI